MNAFLASTFAGILGAALASLGTGAALYFALIDEDNPIRTNWALYCAKLDGELQFQLIRNTGANIARIQVVSMAILIALSMGLGEPVLFILAGLIGILPYAVLSSNSAKRREQLELQLDSWLLMLANALKATPAIGEAIRSTITLVQPPIAEEVDLMTKENQLGTPLDKAVLNASERMGSPTISGALATLVIARQTGGNLSEILETSAGSLREMQRLDGVVRTKTAEGKGQLWVLGVMPFVMTGLLTLMDENWLVPLTNTGLGYVVLTLAGVFWLVAILWARKILDVDI